MTGEALREIFGKTLVELAPQYPTMLVLDADIAGGVGTHHFRTAYPKRFIQFGIAEQNMMAAASGLASVGWMPVAATFDVFCLRAAEQIRMLVRDKRNVKVVGRGGEGPDGTSSYCCWGEDIAYFSALPMLVLVPKTETEMREFTKRALDHDGPVYLKTSRNPAPP